MVEPNKHFAPLDQRLIRSKLISQLLHNSVPTLLASQGVALLLYWALKPDSPEKILNGWIIFFSTISIARLINISINRRKFTLDSASQIARDYKIGALSGGLCWALLIFIYDSSAPLFSQLFLLITLVGMPAASLATNAIYFPVFLAFGIPILLSTVLWSLFFSTSHQLQFSLMASVYSCLIVYIAKQYSSNLKSSIESEEENQILIREIKVANVKLHKLAYKDPLTNLSNRRQFEQNAEQLMLQLQSVSTSLALMLFDIDNFKTVNDTLGHEAGDQLLKEISNRIKSSSRQSELIAQSHAEAARIGGDEFVVMYHINSIDTEIKELANRILHDISKPMALGNSIFKPSVSIGIALAPQHATQIKTLLRIADSAMYRAKKAGGNQFVIANNDDQPENHVLILQNE